ncbi:MAG: RNase P subunit p30 family protein [Nitrososphaerota archaeon]
MPRRFVDAWLRPRSRDVLEGMLRSCHELGFWGVAVEGGDDLWVEARRVAGAYGLEVFRRVTVEASSRGELYEKLRAVRWSYDLVSVATHDRDVLLAAVRDMRVDTVIASSPRTPPIDRHVVEVTGNSLELALLHILEGGFEAFRTVTRVVWTAYKKRLNLVVSTGARDEYELRPPRQMASVPWSLGASPSYALDAVSSYPARILLENRGRLEGRVSVDGVWRVAEGEEEVSTG